MRKAFLLIALLLPALASAQTAPPGPFVTTWADVESIFADIIDWIFTLVVILCVVFILYGSFLYMTSSGDSSRVSKANQTLLFAVIGLAVAVLAWSIVTLVSNFVRGGGGGAPPIPPL